MLVNEFIQSSSLQILWSTFCVGALHVKNWASLRASLLYLASLCEVTFTPFGQIMMHRNRTCLIQKNTIYLILLLRALTHI